MRICQRLLNGVTGEYARTHARTHVYAPARARILLHARVDTAPSSAEKKKVYFIGVNVVQTICVAIVWMLVLIATDMHAHTHALAQSHSRTNVRVHRYYAPLTRTRREICCSGASSPSQSPRWSSLSPSPRMVCLCSHACSRTRTHARMQAHNAHNERALYRLRHHIWHACPPARPHAQHAYMHK